MRQRQWNQILKCPYHLIVLVIGIPESGVNIQVIITNLKKFILSEMVCRCTVERFQDQILLIGNIDQSFGQRLPDGFHFRGEAGKPGTNRILDRIQFVVGCPGCRVQSLYRLPNKAERAVFSDKTRINRTFNKRKFGTQICRLVFHRRLDGRKFLLQ